MVIRVLLDVSEGSLETGFRVTMRIGESGKPYHLDRSGSFPPAPNLLQTLRQWQSQYQGWGDSHRWRAIEIPPQITQVSSLKDLVQAQNEFQSAFQDWLYSRPLSELREQIVLALATRPNQSARLILQTNHRDLQRLPWHLWSLFDLFPKLDFTLHAGHAPPSLALRGPVRVLAIIGGDQGLDTSPDLEALTRLPNCRLTLLEQPTRQVLCDRLHEGTWDVLYFAGHSQSSDDNNQCRIYINKTDFFSPDSLCHAIQTAIAKGLQLAILNSCQGLGIAQQLADLRLPRTVVMREPVLDSVAHAFAKYFLGALSQGHHSDRALQIARKRLAEEVEQSSISPCPGASWMPVIWQNPVAAPLIWPKRNLWLSAAGGAMITSLLVAVGLSLGVSWWERHKFELASSQGEQILVEPNAANSDKQKAVLAYAQGEFDRAAQHLAAAHKAQPDDAETLVYRNNLLDRDRPSVTIAVMLPFSTLPDIAQEMLRGIAQAQQEIYAKGGIPMAANSPKQLLRILLVDDAHNPTQAADFARYLGRHSEATGVVGHYSSGVALKAREEYQRAKLPAIFPTATSVNLSDDSDYTFRTAANDASAGQALADHLHRQTVNGQPIRRVLAYYDVNNNYSRSLLGQLTEAFQKYGGEIQAYQLHEPKARPPVSSLERVLAFLTFKTAVGEVAAGSTQNSPADPSEASNDTIAFPSGNFLDSLDENLASDKPVQAIALLTNTDDLPQTLELLPVNHKRLPVVAGDSFLQRSTLQVGRENAEGMVVAVPWGAPKGCRFLKDSRNFWQGEVTWRTATSYDATQALVSAIALASQTQTPPTASQTKTQLPSPIAINQALKSPDLKAKGACDRAIVFKANGDRQGQGQLVRVSPKLAPDRKDPTPWDFEPVPQPSDPAITPLHLP